MSAASKKSSTVSNLSKLSLDPPKKSKSKAKVADSWDDEDISSGSESDNSAGGSGEGVKQGVAAPPPTPISPTYRATPPFSNSASGPPSTAAYGDSSPSRRPEKTDAVARRLIAGALGVKAPKMTEEQRAYEKAIREQERKRRDAEKAAEKARQEAAEKAKSAMWED